MSTAIVWFRRDLRVHDHPALATAWREYDRVLPLFIFDPKLLAGRYESPSRTGFMIGCLEDLDRSLRDRGSGLVLLEGSPEQRLPEIARELDAGAVLWTSDVSPYARDRDQRVREALQTAGVRSRPQPGNYVAEIGQLKTGSGTPYRVFSPFHRTWANSPRREIHRPPQQLNEPLTVISDHPFRKQIGRLASGSTDGPAEPLVAPGESAARKSADDWLESGMAGYGDDNRMAEPASSSRLSPYLRWGCLSPAELEARALARSGEGAAAWVRQLCWRDFYAHVLLHWPDNLRLEFQPRLRGLEWQDDPERLTAWQEGMTGYPVIDAAMRQLARTGWMPNRARLIVGSFLTKDLQLDWRHGEQWFARLLLDGEPAQNNGNWQWIASVGTDPAPVSRRLYNPVTQAGRHDPDGEYVRRWVPELAGMPLESLHAPWAMSESDQSRAGCRVGRDYPEPIVEHAFERRIALERYARTRENCPKVKV